MGALPETPVLFSTSAPPSWAPARWVPTGKLLPQVQGGVPWLLQDRTEKGSGGSGGSGGLAGSRFS